MNLLEPRQTWHLSSGQLVPFEPILIDDLVVKLLNLHKPEHIRIWSGIEDGSIEVGTKRSIFRALGHENDFDGQTAAEWIDVLARNSRYDELGRRQLALPGVIPWVKPYTLSVSSLGADRVLFLHRLKTPDIDPMPVVTRLELNEINASQMLGFEQLARELEQKTRDHLARYHLREPDHFGAVLVQPLEKVVCVAGIPDEPCAKEIVRTLREMSKRLRHDDRKRNDDGSWSIRAGQFRLADVAA